MKNSNTFLKRPLALFFAGAIAVTTLSGSANESTVEETSSIDTNVNVVSFNVERSDSNETAEPVIVDETVKFDPSTRPVFKTAVFDPEVIEENEGSSWEELLKAQEEFEKEQKKLEEEKLEQERLEEEKEKQRVKDEREAKLKEERLAEEEKKEKEEQEKREEEIAQREAEQEEEDEEEQERNSTPERSTASSNSSSASSRNTNGYENGPTGGGCGGWGDLIREHFGDSQYAKACSVMTCESEGNPRVENPVSTASGLFQFLDTTWAAARTNVSGGNEYDRAKDAPAEMQIEAAAKWQKQTAWSQWVCQ